MFSLLPTALVVLLTLGAPMPQATQSLAGSDALDFLLALHEPGPGSVTVDVIDVDDTLIATITRVLSVPGTEKLVMFRTTYMFPSTIYAHSAVPAGFNADEMD